MRRQAPPWIKFLFATALSSVAAHALAHEPQPLPLQRRKAHIPINDFAATDQSGHRFEFNSLRGKVVLVAFAYTSCPDVCPLITAAARQVQLGLTSLERSRVQLLTVTTDPEIDSPQVLSAYASRYNADFGNWLFLTGSAADLGKIWKNFGIGVKRKARGLIDHTPLTAIVDKRGIFRIAYVGASPDPRLVLADLRRLLSEH